MWTRVRWHAFYNAPSFNSIRMPGLILEIARDDRRLGGRSGPAERGPRGERIRLAAGDAFDRDALALAEQSAGIGVWSIDLTTARVRGTAQFFRIMGLEPTSEQRPGRHGARAAPSRRPRARRRRISRGARWRQRHLRDRVPDRPPRRQSALDLRARPGDPRLPTARRCATAASTSTSPTARRPRRRSPPPSDELEQHEPGARAARARAHRRSSRSKRSGAPRPSRACTRRRRWRRSAS